MPLRLPQGWPCVLSQRKRRSCVHRLKSAPACRRPACRAAPVTAANLVLNVRQGLYNGTPLVVSSNTVLVGAPATGTSSGGEAELDDAAAAGGTAVPLGGAQGSGGSSRRAAPAALPLEILAQGDFEPVYRSPLDVRNGELPVLPLSIYGAGKGRVVWEACALLLGSGGWLLLPSNALPAAAPSCRARAAAQRCRRLHMPRGRPFLPQIRAPAAALPPTQWPWRTCPTAPPAL